MFVWSGATVIPSAVTLRPPTEKVKTSAVNVSAPNPDVLEKSKLAWRLVNEELKFEFPGNRLKLPENVIELLTVEPFRVKLFTVKVGWLNERNDPIETVEPAGVKLMLLTEKPVVVRLKVPRLKVSKPPNIPAVTVAEGVVAMIFELPGVKMMGEVCVPTMWMVKASPTAISRLPTEMLNEPTPNVEEGPIMSNEPCTFAKWRFKNETFGKS
jgi:hypothetical protein